MDEKRQREDHEEHEAEHEPDAGEKDEHRASKRGLCDSASVEVRQPGEGATKLRTRTCTQRHIRAIDQLVGSQPAADEVFPQYGDRALSVVISRKGHKGHRTADDGDDSPLT